MHQSSDGHGEKLSPACMCPLGASPHPPHLPHLSFRKFQHVCSRSRCCGVVAGGSSSPMRRSISMCGGSAFRSNPRVYSTARSAISTCSFMSSMYACGTPRCQRVEVWEAVSMEGGLSPGPRLASCRLGQNPSCEAECLPLTPLASTTYLAAALRCIALTPFTPVHSTAQPSLNIHRPDPKQHLASSLPAPASPQPPAPSPGHARAPAAPCSLHAAPSRTPAPHP